MVDPSRIRDPGSCILDMGSGIQAPGYGIQDRGYMAGSCVQDLECDPGIQIRYPRSWTWDPGSCSSWGVLGQVTLSLATSLSQSRRMKSE